MSKHSHRHAFTLVELLTVIAIIGILAALMFPIIAGVLRKTRAAESIANLKEIGKISVIYTIDNNFKALPAYDDVDSNNRGDESWLEILAFYTTGRSGKPTDYTASYTDPEWRLGADPEYKSDEIGIALNVQPGLPRSSERNDAGRRGKHFSMSSIGNHPTRLLAVQWDSTEITGTENFAAELKEMKTQRGQTEGINMVYFDGHTRTVNDPEKFKNAILDPVENLKQ